MSHIVKSRGLACLVAVYALGFVSVNNCSSSTEEPESVMETTRAGSLKRGQPAGPRASGDDPHSRRENSQSLTQAQATAADLIAEGAIYEATGQLDLAFKKYAAALLIGRLSGNHYVVGAALNNLGVVRRHWGDFDEAMKYFDEAAGHAIQADRKDLAAQILANIGNVQALSSRPRAAIHFLEKALAFAMELGLRELEAATLDELASAYARLGDRVNAEQLQDAGLIVARAVGRKDRIGIVLGNVGDRYGSWQQYDKAIEYYEEALGILTDIGADRDVASCLGNIGNIRLLQGLHSEAVAALAASIALLEKIRKTAPGSLRREYLASQMATYELLTLAYIRSGNVALAFETVELSRAKYLAEQLVDMDSVPPVVGIRKTQLNIAATEAVLIFANTRHEDFVSFLLTDTFLHGNEMSHRAFLESVEGEHAHALERRRSATNGSVRDYLLEQRKVIGAYRERGSFEAAIVLYRDSLLSGATHADRGIELNENRDTVDPQKLGHLLYSLLIKPIEHRLQGKDRLTIVPDGILSIIPFETLIDDGGKYLVERFEIRYVHSMSVLDHIGRRRYEERKPLIAFGGATYEKAADPAPGEFSRSGLQEQVQRSLEQGLSLRSAYGELGTPNWAELPGTLKEVLAIGSIVPEAKLMVGDAVDESALKLMSRSRELEKFQILHFATHGVVVPEIPELSAIVLSQFGTQRNGEDGYLRMGEIADLHLKADMVVLSACDTGLGKIYSGEGLVGLTQSFLIAGSNAIVVSLWKIDDQSTAALMPSVYQHSQASGASYVQSITAVKRRFLSGEFGEELSSPYHWAPFVYYGQ